MVRCRITLFLNDLICTCMKCPLGHTRTKFVFGVGNPKATLMLVGEAPGADEDAQGEPFVGRAGQLLNKILEAIGFRRDEVYICNILKCRPPNNRKPQPEEVEHCLPYLRKQIELVQPALILCLGLTAAENLLGTTESLGRLRGRTLSVRGDSRDGDLPSGGAPAEPELEAADLGGRPGGAGAARRTRTEERYQWLT